MKRAKSFGFSIREKTFGANISKLKTEFLSAYRRMQELRFGFCKLIIQCELKKETFKKETI